MQIPDFLQRVVFGQAAFQFLATGIELGLFDVLRSHPLGLSESEIANMLGLQPRAAGGLLLGCTALNLIERTERAADSTYHLCPAIRELFDAGWWRHFIAIVRFEAEIVGPGQRMLTESLRQNTNIGLQQLPGHFPDLYRRLGEDPHLKEVFFRYMSTWSEFTGRGLVSMFPANSVRRVLDLGGGDGTVAVTLARAFPNLQITMTDFPPACELARKAVAEANLSNRIAIRELDMFVDDFPKAHDCIIFVHQLVIWSREQCIELLRKAYSALPAGGSVVIYNSMSNNDRSGSFFAAMHNAYFLTVPSQGGFIHTDTDYTEFLKVAGFAEPKFTKITGWTPHGMISAIRK